MKWDTAVRYIEAALLIGALWAIVLAAQYLEGLIR